MSNPFAEEGDFEEEPEEETNEVYRTFVAKYAVDRTGAAIGRGTFSIVRRTTERSTGRAVATKIVPSRFALEITRETELMKRVDEGTILKLMDVFACPRNVFLVMELAQGGELFSHIRERGSLTDEQSRIVTTRILQGVAHLHSQGIVHRDLKPQNILCRSSDPTDVVIADFGLSKILSEDTMLRTCCGSPHYLAPEVLAATSSYDSKVDVWSVGVIAFVSLTGCLPFFDPDIRVLVGKVLRAEYSWPDDVLVSPLARDFVAKLLERDPMRRLSAADALRHPWLLRMSSGITLGGR